MGSLMSTMTVGGVISDASAVAGWFGAAVAIVLAVTFGPRLLRAGIRLITKG